MFVGVISFGDSLCYAGPCSSSLSLVLCFLGCLGCLEGGCPVVMSLFLLICLVLHICIPCLLSFILCAGFRWAG